MKKIIKENLKEHKKLKMDKNPKDNVIEIDGMSRDNKNKFFRCSLKLIPEGIPSDLNGFVDEENDSIELMLRDHTAILIEKLNSQKKKL